MNYNVNSSTLIASISTKAANKAPRSPVPMILAWLSYSLLALGYFAYQSAWLSTMCIAAR
jgi:hypothetical protein